MTAFALMLQTLYYHRTWMSFGLLLTAAVAFFSLVPQPPAAVALPFFDKIEHFSAYAVLMVWFVQLYPRERHGRLGLALIALGFSIECLQALGGHRLFELADIGANSAGVGIGWLVGRTPGARVLWAVETRFLVKRSG